VSDPDQDSVLPDPRPGIVDATARGPQAGDGLAPDTGEPGFAVYLHWPFCAAKCPYCDFNSHVRHAGVDQQAYVSAFGSEIAAIRALSGPQVVTSVFFGGGTPSLMKPETVAAILDAVRAAWAVRISATLAFLGVGIQAPTPEWGAMIRQGAEFMISGQWWVALFPGFALILLVFGLNLLGDGLQDLMDPRRRASK
jgi:hypothetical protein